jgi:hypothetical protein
MPSAKMPSGKIHLEKSCLQKAIWKIPVWKKPNREYPSGKLGSRFFAVFLYPSGKMRVAQALSGEINFGFAYSCTVRLILQRLDF